MSKRDAIDHSFVPGGAERLPASLFLSASLKTPYSANMGVLGVSRSI